MQAYYLSKCYEVQMSPEASFTSREHVFSDTCASHTSKRRGAFYIRNPKDAEKISTLRVHEAILSYMKRYQNSYVIDPDSTYTRRWDFTVISALIFTAIVAPFELVFLKPELNPLFVINRIVDFIFLKDMVLHFFLPYWEPNGLSAGGCWVKDLKAIQMHYLWRWLLIDLVSIFPFDIVALFLKMGSVSGLRIFRIIRLLRLLKLLRMLKASRIARRLETSISFRLKAFLRIVVLMVVGNHWLACLWSLIGLAYFHSGQQNWISAHFQGNRLDTVHNYSQIYSSASTFAAMTIFTIGYGDIIPTNTGERWAAVFMMLTGAFLWAYALGNASGLTMLQDLETSEYKHLIDDLNQFLAEQRMPNDSKIKMRRYFTHIWGLMQYKKDKELIASFSPLLKKSTSQVAYPWIKKLPWYGHTSSHFLTTLAHTMNCAIFCPYETLPSIDHLCVVNKGVASRKIIILQGCVYGTDVLLQSTFLKDKTRAVAITHTELLYLSKNSFIQMLVDFPLEKKYLRRFAIWIAIRRAMRLISFFSKTGWDLSSTTKIPFVDHGDKEVHEKYKQFVLRLHPGLSLEFATQRTYEVERLITLTEQVEHQKIADLQNMLGQSIATARHTCTVSHQNLFDTIRTMELQISKSVTALSTVDAHFDRVVRALQKASVCLGGGGNLTLHRSDTDASLSTFRDDATEDPESGQSKLNIPTPALKLTVKKIPEDSRAEHNVSSSLPHRSRIQRNSQTSATSLPRSSSIPTNSGSSAAEILGADPTAPAHTIAKEESC